MKTSGPATNYSLSRGSLGWSHAREPRADLDLLLTLELGEWPEAAGRWAARERHWPPPQVITPDITAILPLVTVQP